MGSPCTPPRFSIILANRWSSIAFDKGYVLTKEELCSLVEGARWAPSAHNLQPWKFIIGVRGSEIFNRILPYLVEYNQQWVKNASAVFVNIHNSVRATEFLDILPPSEFDLGLAAKQLPAD